VFLGFQLLPGHIGGSPHQLGQLFGRRWFPSRAEALAVQILDELAKVRVPFQQNLSHVVAVELLTLSKMRAHGAECENALTGSGGQAAAHRVRDVLWGSEGMPVQTLSDFTRLSRFSNTPSVRFPCCKRIRLLDFCGNRESASMGWSLLNSMVCFQGKYDTVRSCVRGQIHDSSPVDSVSSLGARFTTWSVSQALGRSVFGLPALTRAGAYILDTLFLREFERQRADYWFTLKESSVSNPSLFGGLGF
jgi:hypothetical protein